MCMYVRHRLSIYWFIYLFTYLSTVYHTRWVCIHNVSLQYLFTYHHMHSMGSPCLKTWVFFYFFFFYRTEAITFPIEFRFNSPKSWVQCLYIATESWRRDNLWKREGGSGTPFKSFSRQNLQFVLLVSGGSRIFWMIWHPSPSVLAITLSYRKLIITIILNLSLAYNQPKHLRFFLSFFFPPPFRPNVEWNVPLCHWTHYLSVFFKTLSFVCEILGRLCRGHLCRLNTIL